MSFDGRQVTATSTPYLFVNNIEVIYDHVILVLKGVSLAVDEGAIVALLGGIAAALVGLVFPPLRALYDYAWFVGFGVAFVLYVVSMRGRA